ncbi:cupin domain-containing protein [Granulicella arctica]|uniref:Mannose-6-phosphate isomerase-like protein (Cupin superfamily) n=1 Tax=Granulicella arctica TaxID=940613 RepID=A0A7Y9PHH5_9BACT|nr:twin-arginine translocation signal domain-containing protein [Granulicella arctica]NYF79985.1 mannose-6-phosphate isomerase-like protein (cupin superfamily) [Granulicella arctica]
MIQDPSRRNFLRTAPAATVAGLALSEVVLYRSGAAQSTAPEPFQVFTSETIGSMVHGLEASPGNKDLVKTPALPFSITFTSEQKKSAKEFEYHEGRHHIFHIIEGSTTFELGGTPQSPHSTAPGEWLAPTSAGSTLVTLHKGDILVIPKGTPHKRSTEESVTLSLVSIESPRS